MRCKLIVENELAKLGLHVTKVELGQADIIEAISIEQLGQMGGLGQFHQVNHIIVSNIT